MKVYLTVEKNRVLIAARAEGEGMLGDLFEEVRPGESFWGFSYEDLKKHGSGELEISEKGKSMVTYYELRGIGWDKKYPSGLFRKIETATTISFERMDANGAWVEAPSLIRYIAGYSDDAYVVTKEWADEVLEYYRKKKK